ncbi:MAG: class B sortase, partial [Lachnospiraceae bacterium]|nr:class B sortase [Lachnospiraceae bacterium]
MIVACIMLGSGGLLVMVFVQDNLEEKYWKKLASLKDVENSVSDDSILSEYSALYEQNTDMIGWIKIDGTTIDYPVMQTKDSPEYYLRRNFNKEEEGGGTPFVD